MIKVIVAITTYNLDKYIAQALDSVLAQKTTFPFKIIVADDHSTDKTPDILSEYEKKYPGIIKILYSDRNLGSVGNANRIFDGIQCEYFSFLDGDDYWVREDRLQKQVDFLDSHQDYSMCAGNTQFLRNEKLAEMMMKPDQVNREYYFEDYLTSMPFVHTSSMLVRNTIFVNGLPSYFKDFVGTYRESVVRGEDIRRVLHLMKGPIYVMDELFSVYRIHQKGLFQGSSNVKKKIEAAIQYDFYNEYFKNQYGDFFENRANSLYQNMMLYLMANRLIVSENLLTSKDGKLLADFIASKSNRDGYNKEVSHMTLRIKILKFLTKILHLF